jgi:hypothetical protein
MDNGLIDFYYKISYFAQKTAGWKDPKKGFKNYLVACCLFISSGFVISLFLPVLSQLAIPFPIIFYVIYAIIYYKYIAPFIEMKVDRDVNYELFDSLFEKTNTIQRILCVLTSMILIFYSILIMVFSFYLFVKLWKMFGMT